MVEVEKTINDRLWCNTVEELLFIFIPKGRD